MQTCEYYWDGGRLSAMTVTSNGMTETLKVYDDANGLPHYLTSNAPTCMSPTCRATCFRLSTALLDKRRSPKNYDAWGKLISKTGTSSDYASIYEYNPLTYRGYIYDSETDFY